MLPKEGGARGEMARGISDDAARVWLRFSKRCEIDATAISSAGVVTAELAALQTGHMWEEAGPEVRSAQKWNCAPRKIIARSTAKMRMRNRPRCMWLIGWSLGKKGCEVKARIWEISGRLTNTRSSGKLQAL